MRELAVVCALLLTYVLTTEGRCAESTWKIGTPIVTYYAGPAMTDAVAQQMAEGGLNVVWCGRDQLDMMQRHHLRGMVRDGLLAPATLDDPAKRAQLDALIDSVKNHPAMYAYYLIDEPNASRFPEFGKLVAYLRERDPAHLAYINLFPTYATNEQLGNKGDVATAYNEHLQQFVDIVKPDMLSYDHYHFAVAGDSGQYFLNLGLIRQAALKARIPFLNIVQACTWSPSMRIPSSNEVRWLVNTSLAYGAQGVSYYVYSYPRHLGALATADGQPTVLYQSLKRTNRDFAACAAQLQPLQSLGAYHCGTIPLGGVALPDNAPFRLDPALPASQPVDLKPTEGFVLGYFGPAGGAPTHVVVANLNYSKSAETTLVAPSGVQVFNPARGTWSATRASRLPLRLEPGAAELIRLAK